MSEMGHTLRKNLRHRCKAPIIEHPGPWKRVVVLAVVHPILRGMQGAQWKVPGHSARGASCVRHIPFADVLEHKRQRRFHSRLWFLQRLIAILNPFGETCQVIIFENESGLTIKRQFYLRFARTWEVEGGWVIPRNKYPGINSQKSS